MAEFLSTMPPVQLTAQKRVLFCSANDGGWADADFQKSSASWNRTMVHTENPATEIWEVVVRACVISNRPSEAN